MLSLFIFIPLIFIFVIAIILLVFYIIRSSGHNLIDQLLKNYPTTNPAPDNTISRQTVKIGSVIWKNCVELGYNSEGLYLQINAPLQKYSPLFIPKPQLSLTGHGKLYWQDTTIISIGQPPIATLELITQDHSQLINFLAK